MPQKTNDKDDYSFNNFNQHSQ